MVAWVCIIQELYFGLHIMGHHGSTWDILGQFVALLDILVCNREKEDQRDDFYYSMILLFVPFRDEGTLINKDETMEEAFNRLLANNSRCKTYLEKVQKAHSVTHKVKDTNEAREEENKDKDPVDDDDDDDGPQVVGEATTAFIAVVASPTAMNVVDVCTTRCDNTLMLKDWHVKC